jgi:hypothetical protein
MGAIPIGQIGYISKAPPWSKRMFKMGRLGFPPGAVPPHLYPFLLKKGDVSGIVSKCKAEGKAKTELVKCIFTGVGIARRKGR